MDPQRSRPVPLHYRDCRSSPAGLRAPTGCNCAEIEARNRRDAVVRGLEGISDDTLRTVFALRPDLARRVRAVIEQAAQGALLRPTDFPRAVAIRKNDGSRCFPGCPHTYDEPNCSRPVDFALAAIDYGSMPSAEFDRKYPGWSHDDAFVDGLYNEFNGRQAVVPAVVVPDPEC